MQRFQKTMQIFSLKRFWKNEIRDSLISEKIIEQQEDQNKHWAAKVKSKLDVCLRGNDDNNEQISGPEDMYMGDEYEDNISRILCGNPLTVNNIVTAESVEDMLYQSYKFSQPSSVKKTSKRTLLTKSKN